VHGAGRFRPEKEGPAEGSMRIRVVVFCEDLGWWVGYR
jgi:hypothetical protein